MAILTAYADESGKAGDPNIRCIAIAAVIGTDFKWRKFNRRWQRMCQRHGIPYVHMKEVVGGRKSGRGLFARYKDDQLFVDLVNDAVDCITHTHLHCFGIAVWLDDYASAMRRYGLEADPFAFTLYQTVMGLGTWALNNHPASPAFHLIVDRLEKGAKKVAEAQALYEADTFLSWRGWPAITPLSPKSQQGSSDMPELQAADFIAWLLRRDLLEIEVWMREVKPTLRPRDYKQWSDSLDEWLVTQADQMFEHCERVLPTWAWNRLKMANCITSYHFDQERLETHVLDGRLSNPPADLVERSIQVAGRRYPLSP